MSIRFSSWNTETRLTKGNTRRRGSSEHIMNEIEALNADVLILPEAYDPEVGIDPHVERRMAELGYKHIIDTPYRDRGTRRHPVSPEIAMRIASKLALRETEVVRLGDIRNTLRVTVEDPASGELLDVYGTHFDERGKAPRMDQVEDLAARMKKSPRPKVVMGDFNSMTGESVAARLLNSKAARYLVPLLPGALGDIGANATEMASGEELLRLHELTGLVNADPTGRPTTTPKMASMPFWMPAIPLIDIDHLFVSPDVAVDSLEIMNHDGGSDHRAMSATISVVLPRV